VYWSVKITSLLICALQLVHKISDLYYCVYLQLDVIELTQEIGRCITTITEGNNVFVPAPVHGSSKGQCGLSQNTMITK